MGDTHIRILPSHKCWSIRNCINTTWAAFVFFFVLLSAFAAFLGVWDLLDHWQGPLPPLVKDSPPRDELDPAPPLARLTPAQVADYARHGFLTALDVLTPGEADAARAAVEALADANGGKLDFVAQKAAHLHYPFANKLVRHPRVLDVAQDLLGTDDLLVWGAHLFVKDPGSPAYVSWHQVRVPCGVHHHRILHLCLLAIASFVAIAATNDRAMQR